MSFWAALGGAFTLLFEPPIISLESLRNDKWKKHLTVKNVCFGLFWGAVFNIATSHGVWWRLWEHLLVDANTFCEIAAWMSNYEWLIIAFLIIVSVSGFVVAYLYAKCPHERERLHQVIDSTACFVKSACEVRIIARPVKALSVFGKQLRMNCFLTRMTDDDGEILIIEGSEEKSDSKKSDSKKSKTKLGVPKSIRDQEKRAIESAQSVASRPNGNSSF
ncbi:hypothetical protein ONS95_011984 [Cadophora gregata]|uniref:uncharacterized protein n=1 Tax=Cadophora gregata TaxID=51156 RepID=UPI0026DA7F73|nr:uncharacterized protein ONS95_011984 [Cadophora gregata]KAK0117652.1 hypothetical protein ONS95_011984 [Cadophora gregata]KAK0122702.1 hypothetical protein ONS96_009737 [Cadophora gregata f. sp. sojae]